jgi:hypothetical protein
MILRPGVAVIAHTGSLGSNYGRWDKKQVVSQILLSTEAERYLSTALVDEARVQIGA